MMPNRRKHIQNFALVLRGVADAVGRKQRQPQALGDAQRGLIADFLGAVAVPLQLDVHVVAAEDLDELLNALPPSRFAAGIDRRSQRAFIAAGQADQARGELRQIGCLG